MRGPWGALAAAGAFAVGVTSWAPAAEPVPAAQVFVAFAQRLAEAERHAYLAEHAGRPVEATGHVEALLPRTYFDTSVPDNNPAVLLVQVAPGRKVACGLPALPSRSEMGRYREGTPVALRGALVDAQDWGRWTTLYLSGCSAHPTGRPPE